MTVASTTPIIPYLGTGTTAFAFTFVVFVETDLAVSRITTAGVKTLLTLTTDYTVALNPDGTGTVTTVATYTDGKVELRRILPLTQDTDWVNGDEFDMDLLEDDLDRLVMILQQQQVIVDEGALAVTFKGDWAGPSTDYGIQDSVIAPDTNIYVSIVTHTSTATFADDLASGYWILWIDVSAVQDIADDAEQSATDAETAQTAAELAETNAELAETNAETAQTAAELAETNAETAQTAAELAETNAETAQTAAELAETNAETAQTAAELAETNAETAQTAAETAQAAAETMASAVANPYVHDDSITMADPGTGEYRLNNATVSSATAIAISAQTNDSGNPDISDFISTWADSTNTTGKGYLIFKKSGTPATFIVFAITAVTDNSTWLQLTVTHVASTGTWTAADIGYIQFTRTGDQGGGLANVVEDLTPQCGGFFDPNGNYIGMDKGANIASASPLVIGTDGDYAHVTGTQDFSTMTVVANRHFFLEFDDALTITHGAPITLGGAIDFDTSAGDILECFSTAANVVEVVGIRKADGTAVVAAGGFYDAYINISHQVAGGSQGGTLTSGAWEARLLNTEEHDDAGIAALASNQVTLPAGTYEFDADAIFYQTGLSQLRLYDTTGAAILGLGLEIQAFASGDEQLMARVSGKFTIGVESVIELQSRVQVTNTADGGGNSASFGGINAVFVRLELRRRT